jgi:Uma2 family endonuclease
MATSAEQVLDREETGMIRLRMSYQEWLENVDEHAHTEWVDGEVIIYMPPTPPHQDAVFFLATLLRLFAELRNLGRVFMAPLEIRLASVNASREPDALFIAREHLHRLTDVRLEGPADVAIEGMSKSTARYDRQVKLVEYARAGLPETWFLDPRPGQQPFELFSLKGGGDRYDSIPPDAEGRYHSIVVPGFWVDPAWLTRDPLPRPTEALMEIDPEGYVQSVLDSYQARSDRQGRR